VAEWFEDVVKVARCLSRVKGVSAALSTKETLAALVEHTRLCPNPTQAWAGNGTVRNELPLRVGGWVELGKLKKS